MFKPLHDYVLVMKNESSEKSVGGIVLAQTAQGLESGTVMAVGTGHVNADGSIRPMTVKIGDTVYLSDQYAEIRYDGDVYLLFQESGLIGVEQ